MTSARKPRITFISAGAGSGKTHRLTEILHRELTEKRVRPAGIIATTFTRKAATELRERVRAHLLGQGEFSLANTIGQARIGTVNSVCGQLLERFAFEAGMATEQQVVAEVEAGILLGKAIDVVMDDQTLGTFLDGVRRLGLDESWKTALQSLVTLIRANDIAPERLASFARDNAAALLSHFPTPTDEDLDQRLRQAIAAAQTAIEQAALSRGIKKNTQDYLAQLRAFDRSLTQRGAAWSEWVKLAKSAPEAGLKGLVEPIAELAGRLAEHRELHADLTQYLDRMFDLAARALTIYARQKRELGVLDFADQEQQLLKLLDHPAVADVLGEELDLLMVDEFQDTSPIQLALFLKLAGFARQVFWVGDIKQAIYGFRGSDSGLMQAIIQALPAFGGSQEILPSSWRSRPQLVRLVNAVFGHAFADSLSKEAVELQPTRTDPLAGAVLANWILTGRNQAQEAAALAVGVQKLVESGYQVVDPQTSRGRAIRHGDIAVLSRSHAGVQTIDQALRERGIPCATAQPGLLKTPEATLAMACLRRLDDPGDTLATAEIVSMADGAEPEQWVADRLRYLNAGGLADEWLEKDGEQGKAHPLLSRLARLRSSLPLLAPREGLQTVIAICELPAKIVRWSPDAGLTRLRLANLDALLDLAGQYEELCRSGQHAASIAGLILWLGEVAAEEKDLQAEPAIDAVKVMTHHAAKGLEWPVVVLTDLAAPVKDRLWSISAQAGTEFSVHAPLAERFIRYWPWPFGAQQKVALAEAIARTPMAAGFRNSAIEESKRLLYVSMTRARDLMVLARSHRQQSGEWLACLDAPWLLPTAGENALTLPDGEKMAALCWHLEAAAAPVTAGSKTLAQALHWFLPATSLPLRPALSVNPSAAGKGDHRTGASRVLETCRVGEPIPFPECADPNLLGTAIHACLALSFADPRCLIEVGEIERLLRGYPLAGTLSATRVLHQAQALHAWIATRWPDSRAFAEHPVESVLASGQVLNGRLDLLLDAAEGWILIDHKSSPLAPEHWDRLANAHAEQLAAYADAIYRASGRKVVEKWLFLPVAAGCVRVR
ncbi:MAG: UvrD-helicase domain-containing protein [Candidatus Accumulibacter sp. UW26]|jgi:ATP-dependent helicase/nuclease subunit A